MPDNNLASIPPEVLAQYQARIRDVLESEHHEYSSATFHKAQPSQTDDDDEQLRQTLSAEQLDIPVEAIED
jgi:hypothetical protein